jgi:hypothetical protein
VVLRWSIACALVAAAVLRGSRLREQVLAGDEFHALHAALEWPLVEILTTWTYHGADYSVPLGALFRMLFDAGLRLGELELRLPALVLGTLAVAVMPWMLRERLGGRAAGLYAWLLSLAPLLVIYSRMVRSYAPAVLFAFVAVVCFERWWSQRSRRAAVGYAVFAALALWFNLSVAPFLAAPVVYGAARLALGDAALRARTRELLTVACGAAACVALVLLPALESFTTLSAVHGRGGLPSPETWLEVVRMHSGTTSPLMSALVLAALVRGVALSWRREREWLLYLAALALLHLVGLVAIGPDQLDNPIVINRYLLVLLPFGLALSAIGLTEPITRLDPRLQGVGLAAVLVALLATGPLATREFASTSFSTASTFAYFVRDGNSIESEDMPAFYRELATAEGVEPVLEYPWSNMATHAFDAYQKHHRQPVYVVAPWKDLDDERLRLERTLAPRVELYLDSPARWLVVHLDLQREERRVRSSDRNHWMRLTERPDIWQPLRVAGPTTTRLLERRFGPADHHSELLRVWDLARLREGR